MLHIVLLEPEIPQNAGNIARTCAALGARLHLVEPLGFKLEDRYMRRAGLDYWPLVDMRTHKSLDEFLGACPGPGCADRPAQPGAGLFYLTGRRGKVYSEAEFPEEVFFVFGKESTGLPAGLLDAGAGRCLRIPMREGVRSLNLSNAVAVVAYEYARRRGFRELGIKSLSLHNA
ncbi:MAG: tRNA (cytidine(34)-2'-O)-methyltransferase [Spirochaetia bacterium]|nr:tRNA (cytidine(34)-2'-O)-methyltransferase [Spirochaetia bacterium]